MKKLLRKLFLYLFKEDFQRMEALERDLKGLIHRQKCATSEAELRHQMELLQMRHYQFNDLFKYGFGSSHMWVCETNRRNRLIFVEF